MKNYIFKDVDIFDGCNFFKGSLKTDGAVIEKIGEDLVLTHDEESDAEVISGHYLLIPGMVNLHTHAPMSLFKGAAEDQPLQDWLTKTIFPLEAKFISADMSYTAGMWAMAEMLLSGTTAFADMYFFEEDIARAAKEIGIKCMLGEGIVNFPAPTGRSPEQTLEYTAEIAEKYKNDDYIYVAVAPHSPYLTDEKYLIQAFEISQQYNIPMHIHMAETKFEVEKYREKFGIGEFVRLNELGLLNNHFIAAHSVWVDDEEIDIIAEKGVTVAHCPSSNTKLGSGIAPITKMMEKGINVMVSTDGSASNNNLHLLQEAELAAKLQKGIHHDPTLMKAEDMLKAVTSNAKNILGNSFGVLEAGSRADMVLVDRSSPSFSPQYCYAGALLYASSTHDIHSVFVEGKRVVNDRKITSIDMKALQKEFCTLVSEVRNIL